jgi:hypothetical protein
MRRIAPVAMPDLPYQDEPGMADLSGVQHLTGMSSSRSTLASTGEL